MRQHLRGPFILGLLFPISTWAALSLAIGLACSCASNPVSVAQTLEQKAYATYGSFVITEEQADQLVRKNGTPIEVRIAIATADSKAKKSADALRSAFLDYSVAEKELAAGTSTQDKLDIATQNLSQWLSVATNDIQALIAVVKGN